MDYIALFTTSEGRLAQKPFWLALLAVYAASFVSQGLLTGPVLVRSGLWPFAFVQAGLLWCWTVLHIKRLRDAGRPPAGAIAVAVLYGLSLGLALLIAAIVFTPSQPGTEDPARAFLAAALLIAFFLFLFDPSFGPFTMILKALALIACLPFVISLTFSVYTGLRLQAPPVAPQLAPVPAPTPPA